MKYIQHLIVLALIIHSALLHTKLQENAKIDNFRFTAIQLAMSEEPWHYSGWSDRGVSRDEVHPLQLLNDMGVQETFDGNIGVPLYREIAYSGSDWRRNDLVSFKLKRRPVERPSGADELLTVTNLSAKKRQIEGREMAAQK
jgi:hypothetical protein